MPTIKGFTTKNFDEAIEKLEKAGVEFKLPFTATNFTSTKDPSKNDKIKIKFADGTKYKYKAKTNSISI